MAKVNNKNKIIVIKEKPKKYYSDYEITGLYYFDNKVIKYSNQFDNTLFLEGVSDHQGLFEIAFTPHLVTQKLSNYIHNGKDKINKKSLCTF